MMENNLQIYDKIFHIADENMKKNGMKFTYSLCAFHSFINVSPDTVYASEFQNMQNEDFLVAAYIRCFGRLPDETAWGILYTLCQTMNGEKIQIQYAILSEILKSAEFAANGRQLIGVYEMLSSSKNDTQPGKSRQIKVFLLQKKDEIKAFFFQNWIIPVWKRIPNSIRNLIRAVTGREKKP